MALRSLLSVNTSIQVGEYDPRIVVCAAEGSPNPSIRWTYVDAEGRTVRDGEKACPAQMYPPAITFAHLVLLEPHTATKICCTARNSHGSAFTSQCKDFNSGRRI